MPSQIESQIVRREIVCCPVQTVTLANPLVESPRTSRLTGLDIDTESQLFSWGRRTWRRAKTATDAVIGTPDPRVNLTVLAVRHVGKRPGARHRGEIRVRRGRRRRKRWSSQMLRSNTRAVVNASC
jgi:hypothetical protein